MKKFLRSEDLKENKLKLNLFAFDKTKSNVISAKKNARIAEVDEVINFENRELNEERYDKQFKKAENYLEDVLKKIQELNLYKNSIILIISDHGMSVLLLHGDHDAPHDNILAEQENQQRRDRRDDDAGVDNIGIRNALQ